MPLEGKVAVEGCNSASTIEELPGLLIHRALGSPFVLEIKVITLVN